MRPATFDFVGITTLTFDDTGADTGDDTDDDTQSP
jgi:hypothetical protein